MSEENKNTNADDVVRKMLMSEDDLNSGALLRWVEKYPQYQKEIVEAAAFSAQFDLFDAENPLPVSSEARERDWLAVKSVLDKFQIVKTPTESLFDLREAAAKIGLKRESLLNAAGVSETLMRKIERRNLTEIPRWIQERLAETLRVSVESLQTFFDLPTLLPKGANYKSKTAPKAQPKQTFAEAVKTDPELTAKEKARLLDLTESENENSKI